MAHMVLLHVILGSGLATIMESRVDHALVMTRLANVEGLYKYHFKAVT
jgi:hypothetical protein